MSDSSHRKIPVLDDIISTQADLNEWQTVSVPTIHSSETLLDKTTAEPALNPVEKPADGDSQKNSAIDIHALSETIFEPRIEPVIDGTIPAVDNEEPQLADSAQKPEAETPPAVEAQPLSINAVTQDASVIPDIDSMTRQIVQTLLPDLEQQLNKLIRTALEDRLKNKHE